MKKELLLLYCCLFPMVIRADTLTVYPAPKGIASNDTFTVKVRSPQGQWRTCSAMMFRSTCINRGRPPWLILIFPAGLTYQ